MVKLEVISRLPEGREQGRPLLFVHGAWHGAWCWDQGFLSTIARQGHAAYALSLRGHGRSENPGALCFTRIRDYVADVRQAVQSLPSAPVLVGHSMGGFVVQKYLALYPAPGAVLLASVPPSGVWRTTLSIHLRHLLRALRMHATLSLLPLVDSPAMVRELFFSPALPQTELERYAALVQDESYLAFLDMLVLDLPRPKRVNTPVRVLGGELDAIFSPAEVRATARAYRTGATMFPGMAHDMMLEPGWEAVARSVLEFVAGLPDATGESPQ